MLVAQKIQSPFPKANGSMANDLRKLPLTPNPAVLEVDAAVEDVEPARGEAANNQLPVCVIFLLAPGKGVGLIRIEAGAALNVLHEEGDGRIEDVRHFVAGIPCHELLLIGIGFIPTTGDHIAAVEGPVRSRCGRVFILTEIEGAEFRCRAKEGFLDELSEGF
jgi:hypothetical protein